MLLLPYLKRQTASKWQITRSIIIWLNQITNTINKPSFSLLYFEIVCIKRFSTLFCHTLSLFLFLWIWIYKTVELSNHQSSKIIVIWNGNESNLHTKDRGLLFEGIDAYILSWKTHFTPTLCCFMRNIK
jgi:hypothetical protein